MQHHAWPVVAVLCMLLPASEHVVMASGGESPFTMKRFDAIMIDSAEHRARLTLIAEMAGSGEVTIALGLPTSGRPDDGSAKLLVGEKIATVKVKGGEHVERSWDVILPGNGYVRMAEASLLYTPGTAWEARRYERADAINLYAAIERGVLASTGNNPDRRFVHAPVDISPSMKSQGRTIATGETFQITITGQVNCRNADLDHVFLHGVPGVRVYFDWDSDNNPNTYLHPFYGSGQSDYAITDADGNYTFTRQVISSGEHDFIWNTEQIRAIARSSNDAAYGYDSDPTDVFSDAGQAPISLSYNAIHDISLSIPAFTVDAKIGNALRYLWRAREFSTAQFGFTPLAIRFKCDDGNGRSSFVSPNLFYHTHIQFIGYPNSETAYHEYGHYIDYLNANTTRYRHGECVGHDWESVTDDACAFVEGWGEFYSAATHAYWYDREQPALREDEYHNTTALQFPDYGQALIPTNKGEIEGGVASFLYDLWDDIYHHRGYAGDNEDLGEPFGYPARMLLDATYLIQHLGVTNGYIWRQWPYIEAYRDAFISAAKMRYPLTARAHEASIMALYRQLTDSTEFQRSASPTDIHITSSDPKSYRTLSWHDNTEPAQLSYQTETQGLVPVDLYRNNETSFAIYRKLVGQDEGPWVWHGTDRRQDRSYQEIDRIPGEITTWTDNELLPPGLYSYVVVAVNPLMTASPTSSFGKSLAKSEASIAVGRNITIRREGWDQCEPIVVLGPGETQRYTASTTGSGATSKRWLLTNTPTFITATGTTSDTLTLTNGYQSGAINTCNRFAIRCVVSSGTVSDTSGYFYPPYTPLGEANAFVAVRQDQSLLPDSSFIRALDFVTHPGREVISIRRLTTPPLRITNGGGYEVTVQGFPCATTTYNHARLLRVDHPSGTELGGSAACGFVVYRHDGAALLPDSSHLYGIVELPMSYAAHSQSGAVTDLVRELDSLGSAITAAQHLTFTFVDPPMPDSMAIESDTSLLAGSPADSGWTHDYLLELSAIYQPLGGSPGPVGAEASSIAEAIPSGNTLEQNSPNPAMSTTTVRYGLEEDGPVRLELYNAAGELLRTPIDGAQRRGEYALTLDLTGLPSGLYYYRLRVGAWERSRMMMVVR
jgi:hypothetical protein